MELLEIFRKLGLTRYESKVYESLIVSGKTDARIISKNSGVPQTAVYPSLSELISFGLIQKFEGDLSVFEVIDPKIAMAKYVEKKRHELKDLEKKAIEQSLELEKQDVEKRPRKVLEIGMGKEFSRNIYFKAFEEAKEKVEILGWRFQNIGDRYKFIHAIKGALDRGVIVKIITIGELGMKNKQLIRDYKRIGVKFKFLPLEDISMLLVDSKKCKLTIKKRGEEKTNINILDERLSEFLADYFSTLWKRAEKI